MSLLAFELLLRTWPRDFRQAHGRAARDAAVDEFRHAVRLHGRLIALLRTVPLLILDLVVTALRLRRDQLFGNNSPDPLARLPHSEKNPMDSLFQDIRYGIRYLSRTPGVTAVAVTALALGIGANTLVFSLVNGILLQPLPFEDPDRLVHLWETNLDRGWDSFSVSPQNYRDWKEQTTSFSQMTGLYDTTITITGGDEPVLVEGAMVADDFFLTLGAELALGRGFSRDEHVDGASVVVIGPGMWQRRFGRRADVLGEEIIVDGAAQTIIGVLADPAAAVPSGTDVWMPMDLDGAFTVPRGAHWWRVVARMNAEVTLEQASNDVKLVADRLPLADSGWSAVAASMHGDITERANRSLAMLFGAVGLVLLIACANVANLLLARAGARARELSLRHAVGASASRLFRQMLTESVVLSSIGALLGIGVAFAGLRTVRAFAGDTLPRMGEVGIDPAVLLFTLAVGIVTGLVFGVIPALQGMRVTPAEALKEGGAGSGLGRGRARLRSALVVVEIALAVSVVSAAGLLARSLVELQSVDPGFAVDQRVSARIALPDGTYPDRPARIAFYDGLLDSLRSSPAVVSAGATSRLPLGSDFNISFGIVGQTDANDENRASAELRVIDPDYFDSMSIPLLRGRGLLRSDTAQGEHVVVVNERFVKRFFPDSEPIGAVLDIGYGTGVEGDPRERRVVGVVSDVKAFSLGDESRPMYYLSRHQTSVSNLSIVLHTTATQEQAFALLRTAVQEADPNLALYQVRTLVEVVRRTTADERLRLGLIASFAVLAMVLSGIGIYGMLSFGVAERRREIGVRLAIGAAPADVLRLILRSGISLALIGVVIGSGGALLIGRVLASQLYGVSPYDELTLGAVVVSLLIVATVACWLPARRATRVDPALALRAD